MEITERRLRKVIDVGDEVFTHDRNIIVSAKVVGFMKYGLKTDYCFLSYDTHCEDWWLTRTMALARIGAHQ